MDVVLRGVPGAAAAHVRRVLQQSAGSNCGNNLTAPAASNSTSAGSLTSASTPSVACTTGTITSEVSEPLLGALRP